MPSSSGSRPLRADAAAHRPPQRFTRTQGQSVRGAAPPDCARTHGPSRGWAPRARLGMQERQVAEALFRFFGDASIECCCCAAAVGAFKTHTLPRPPPHQSDPTKPATQQLTPSPNTTQQSAAAGSARWWPRHRSRRFKRGGERAFVRIHITHPHTRHRPAHPFGKPPSPLPTHPFPCPDTIRTPPTHPRPSTDRSSCCDVQRQPGRRPYHPGGHGPVQGHRLLPTPQRRRQQQQRRRHQQGRRRRRGGGGWVFCTAPAGRWAARGGGGGGCLGGLLGPGGVVEGSMRCVGPPFA